MLTSHGRSAAARVRDLVRRCGALAFGAGVLAGCRDSVDLAAVQRYAATTAQARDAFAAIAADYGATCVRRAEVVASAPHLARLPVSLAPAYAAPAAVSPTVASRTAPAMPNTTAPLAVPATGEYAAECADATAVSDAWAAHNAIVLGYVRALGNLAGVDAAPDFTPLAGSLQRVNAMSDAQGTAFASLAAHVGAAVADGRRKDAIARLLDASDADLGVAVAALERVDGTYGTLLETEFDATYRLYRHALEREQRDPLRRLDVDAQRAALANRLAEINRRRAGTFAYAATLDDILAVHRALRARADESGVRAMFALTSDLASRFAGDVAALDKAAS